MTRTWEDNALEFGALTKQGRDAPTLPRLPGAACATAVREGWAHPDDWFPEGPWQLRRLRAGEARAVQICYACDVQPDCLLWAMGQRHSDQNGLHGIWGGLTAAQRESHQILNRAGLPAGRFLR